MKEIVDDYHIKKYTGKKALICESCSCTKTKSLILKLFTEFEVITSFRDHSKNPSIIEKKLL